MGFTNLSERRYSPFFMLLKSGLLSTEAEGRTGRKIQRSSYKHKEQVLVLRTTLSADNSLREIHGCSRMQLQHPCTCSVLCILFRSNCFVLRHRIIWKVQRNCPCTFHGSVLTGGGERHSFLTSALNGGEWSASFFACCISGVKPSVTTD